MKIIVIGASGRVGTLLIDKLRSNGHQAIGTSRNPKSSCKDMIQLDLHTDVNTIADALNGFDVVYFVAGSRGKDLLQTDLNGAVKVMKAAEKKGIKRFIHLSSAFALNQERWQEGYLKTITDYNIAKYFSDMWLIHQTKLEYTILQPSVLTTIPGTGKVNFNISMPSENTIEDVAEVLAQIVDAPNTVDKIISMSNGTQPIGAAIQDI